MPKYNDFDLDLQNTSLNGSSTQMIVPTATECEVLSGRYTCDPVPRCVSAYTENYRCDIL